MALYRMNLRDPREFFPHIILAEVSLGRRQLFEWSLWLRGGVTWASSGEVASSLTWTYGVSLPPEVLLWIISYIAVTASPTPTEALIMSGAAMIDRRIKITSLCALVGSIPLAYPP